MVTRVRLNVACASLMLLSAVCGCQVYNTAQEVRSDEQMLPVSFENDRAKDLFMKSVEATYGEMRNVRRIGLPSLSIYSQGETVAWNANCNDHIRAMDINGDLLITEQEALSHYNSITAARTK